MTSNETPGQTRPHTRRRQSGEHRQHAGAVLLKAFAVLALVPAAWMLLADVQTDYGADRVWQLVAAVAALFAFIVWFRSSPGRDSKVAVGALLSVSIGCFYAASRDGGEGPKLIDVDAKVMTYECGTSWVMEQKPNADFDPGSTESIRNNNGALSSPQFVELSIASEQLRAVTIRDIDVEVVSSNPVSSTAAEFSYPCGDPVFARFIGYDLDSGKVIASSSIERDVREVLTESDPGKPVLSKPMAFPYDINGNENLTLLLAGVTSKDVQWRANLSWTQGSKSGTVTIDDAGKPFRVASSDGLPHRVGYDDDWETLTPGASVSEPSS